MSLVFLVDLYTAAFFLLMSFSFFFKWLHVTSLAGDRLECLSLEGTGHFISFECSFSCLKGSIFLLAWLYHLSLHLQASAFPSPSTSLYLITCQVVILTRSGCKFFFKIWSHILFCLEIKIWFHHLSPLFSLSKSSRVHSSLSSLSNSYLFFFCYFYTLVYMNKYISTTCLTSSVLLVYIWFQD